VASVALVRRRTRGPATGPGTSVPPQPATSSASQEMQEVLGAGTEPSLAAVDASPGDAQCSKRGSEASLSCSASGKRGARRSDYAHLADLGSGACGFVTKVAHVKTGGTFALKAMSKHHVQAHQLQSYVDFEVATQRRLNHPNIVRLQDSFEDDFNVYLLLEFATEGQLFAKIRQEGRLAEAKASTIFSDVVRALVHLHEHSIVHRDLKPENILLFAGDVAKLADFGWCAELSRDERRTFCGTPDYLSPEMLLSQPHDHRVDVWAAGVLLFEMLVGRAPFAGKNTAESMQRIIDADVRMPHDLSLPAGAVELIRGLLQAEPTRRTELSETLRHPWVHPREVSEAQTEPARPDKAVTLVSGVVAVSSKPATSDSAVALVSVLFSEPSAPAMSDKVVALVSVAFSVASMPATSDKSVTHVSLKSSERLADIVPGRFGVLGCPSSLPTLLSVPKSQQNGKGGFGQDIKDQAEGCSLFPTPFRNAVPHIGGLFTLEGLTKQQQHDRVVPGGRGSEGSVESFGAAWFGSGSISSVHCRVSDGGTSSGGSTTCSVDSSQPFILSSCLRPVSERFSAHGDNRGHNIGGLQESAVHAWASAARPMTARPARECEVLHEEPHKQLPGQARTKASWKETNSFQSVRTWVRSDNPQLRNTLTGELDRMLQESWKETHAFSAVRSWVRSDNPQLRRTLTDELDRVIEETAEMQSACAKHPPDVVPSVRWSGQESPDVLHARSKHSTPDVAHNRCWTGPSVLNATFTGAVLRHDSRGLYAGDSPTQCGSTPASALSRSSMSSSNVGERCGDTDASTDLDVEDDHFAVPLLPNKPKIR